MRKIIGIGETVLDILFKDGVPVKAVPGGSTFNSMISLGRMGLNVSFISEVGNDRVGEMILKALEDSGVDASSVCSFSDGKSPLSLAFLNNNNDAEYLSLAYSLAASTRCLISFELSPGVLSDNSP